MAKMVLSAQGLALHHYPAANSVTHSESLVLLHGWGCDSRSWQPLLSDLQTLGNIIAIDLPGFGQSKILHEFEIETVLALLEHHLPENTTLIGWSLGGMLAVALAARAPQKIARIITLAANGKFVVEDNYPAAMPLAVNNKFNQDFASDPERTLKLFSGLLAQGDNNERSLLKSLRTSSLDLQPNHNWREALTLLAQLDNRATFARLTQPGLHIFGAADALVPAAAVSALKALNKHQQLKILPGAAHAMHWSQPQKIAHMIRAFVQPAALDKRKVAQSFSRAAQTYDSVARLQRDIGEHLLQKLPATDSLTRVVDLGCGTGFFCDYLARAFPAAEVIGIDIAEGMLGFARQHRAPLIKWLCGDAENLPVQTASVDLIFSSLAIQWCDNLPHLFMELHRVLKPGGRLIFSTLGPHTLHELKHAWQAVDGYVHVNRFQAAEQVQVAITRAGFALDHWQIQNCVLRYDRLIDLTRELKALGAHNINRGQSIGLTGRHKIEILKNTYEKFRRENYLPATYEVFYGVAQAKNM